MSYKLQIVFILASILTFLFVILRIRRHGLNIDDAIVWILWTLILLFFSLFPIIPVSIAKELGFYATSNLVFTFFILFLYIMIFMQNIKISKLKQKQKDLIQKLSLKEWEESMKSDN